MSEEKNINKILGRTQSWDKETIVSLESQLAAMTARAEAAEVRARSAEKSERTFAAMLGAMHYDQQKRQWTLDPRSLELIEGKQRDDVREALTQRGEGIPKGQGQ